MINLDTHMLILALQGRISPSERIQLTDNQWSIASIVLLELAKLAKLGRVSIDLEDRKVLDVLGRIHVWPIDVRVAVASTRLDFRGDPIDELIAATSVVHRVPLLTRDKKIQKSRVVPLA